MMEVIDSSNMSPIAVIALRLYCLTKLIAQIVINMLSLGFSLPECFTFNTNTGK